MKLVVVLIVLLALAGNLFVASAEEGGEEVQNPIVECSTTKGFIAIEVHREWAPLGADRFLELVKDNFYTNIALFRCVHNFLVQFGISEDPTKKHWHNKNIKDDPNIHVGVKKNYVSFAGGGPNTRSTQLFIAFEDLDFLGNEPWETPFGVVISGEDALNDFYKGYGDIPPFGTGPDQQMIHREGNAYIHRLYPKTDFILSCRVVEPIAAGHNLAEIPNILQPEDGHEHHELILGDFIERAAEDNAQAAPVTIEELAEDPIKPHEIKLHTSETLEDHEIQEAIWFTLILAGSLAIFVVVVLRCCTAKPLNATVKKL